MQRVRLSYARRVAIETLKLRSPGGRRFRVRFDVLNVFNTRNWRNFELFPGNLVSGPNPNFGNHLDGVHATRTAKLSVGFNW